MFILPMRNISLKVYSSKVEDEVYSSTISWLSQRMTKTGDTRQLESFTCSLASQPTITMTKFLNL